MSIGRPIEIYGAIHSEPDKGHDRLYIDDDHLFVGVIDGAGGAELSSAVVTELPDIIRSSAEVRAVSQELFLARVMSIADNLPQGLQRKATMAAACACPIDSHIQINYGNAGDSSLYFYSPAEDNLSQIAHSPTRYTHVGDRQLTDTSDFLGNFRDESSIRQSIGSMLLPKDMKWSVIGFSDGVQDDDGRGIETTLLREILRTTSAAEVPETVLNAIEPYDDASVFVMSRRVM